MSNISEPRMSVLVVEDETLVRIFMADFLDEAGFKIFEAVDAEEALTILQAWPDVQVAIKDVEMPGPMNGFNLARAVHERWPSVIIIVTSGRADPPEDDWPEDIPFINMPYLPATIIGLVRQLGTAADGRSRRRSPASTRGFAPFRGCAHVHSGGAGG